MTLDCPRNIIKWKKTYSFTFCHSYRYRYSPLAVCCITCQDKQLKDLFQTLPTLEELSALGDEISADIILVDAKRDKKLTMLKHLIVALVKGLNSNPAAMIKKIAGLVKSHSL